LVEFVGRERPPAVVSACVGGGDDDSAGREIDTGGDGGCRKYRVEEARGHHLFDQQLPRRYVAGVVRSDAGVDQDLCVSVRADLGAGLGVLGEHLLAAGGLVGIGLLAFIGGDLGGRLVALAAGGQKDDRG